MAGPGLGPGVLVSKQSRGDRHCRNQTTSQGPAVQLTRLYIQTPHPGQSLAKPANPSSFMDGVIQAGEEPYRKGANVRATWGCSGQVGTGWGGGARS